MRGDHFVLRDLGSPERHVHQQRARVRGEAPLKHGDEIALGVHAWALRRSGGGAPVAQRQLPLPRRCAAPSVNHQRRVAPAAAAGPAAYPPPASRRRTSARPRSRRPPRHVRLAPPVPRAQPVRAAPPPLGAGPGGTGAAAGGQAAAERHGGSFVAQGTRIDVNDQARQIGTQIAAVDKGSCRSIASPTT